MAAWRSVPGGHRAARWRDWAVAAGAVWVGASVLGIAVLAVTAAISAALGLAAPGGEGAHPLIVPFVLGYVLFFSPMLSWVGIALALPGVAVLLARGWGGWASFLILGLVAGAVATIPFAGFGTWVGMGFGGPAALAFRRMFVWIRPSAFTTC